MYVVSNHLSLSVSLCLSLSPSWAASLSFSLPFSDPQKKKTKTSKKEIKSALEIFQRELRGTGSDSIAAGGGGASGGGGGGIQQQQQQQPGTFAPVPPAGVQNMAALYLKVKHRRNEGALFRHEKYVCVCFARLLTGGEPFVVSFCGEYIPG